ncbi:MAG: hypothetical protein ACOZDY_06005 [Pseudomonadota bacterium]
MYKLALEKQRPEVIRTSEGGVGHANGRYEDNIRTPTEQVATQERRVEALERERAALAGRPATAGQLR